MPWQENDLMSLKQEFIEQAQQHVMSFSALCARYKIARKTGYKWVRRHAENPAHGLRAQPTTPKTIPNATPTAVVDHIVSARQRFPTWGGRKLRAYLMQEGINDVPAASTISGILKRAGYIQKDSCANRATSRFEHVAPNHLWQMDFKGHFAYEQGRCHPLTIIDDHSRFSIHLSACMNERYSTVKTQLIKAFERYGLPERINVDNGAPWGSIFAVCRYTSLSLWLIEHGIKVSYSRPRHPQTNGKIERFHRTLKQELLTSRYFRQLDDIQQAFDEWRDCYNLVRPHEGINNSVPSKRYHISYRQYHHEIQGYDYAADYQVKRVSCRGRISLDGRQIFIGIPFAGKQVGIRCNASDAMRDIYYRHQRLGHVALSSVKKGTAINLYSKRILET